MIVQQLHHEAIPPLSAMIVDANAASIRRLSAALKDNARVAVRCTARTIPSAIKQAEEHRPDVVFLDGALANGDGLGVARQFSVESAIVVVSDRPDFALEAFEFGAIDYLLKPVSAERLQATLQRIERFLSNQSGLSPDTASGSSPNLPPLVDHVPISSQRSGQRKATELVPVADVIWVESLQNYSIVQLSGGERRQVKRTLTEWAALLPPQGFVRIGRSVLIQFSKLRTITSPARNQVLIYFHGVEKPLRVGRAAASKLRDTLRGSYPA
jgi:two-component system LytT family response regulator